MPFDCCSNWGFVQVVPGGLMEPSWMVASPWKGQAYSCSVEASSSMVDPMVTDIARNQLRCLPGRQMASTMAGPCSFHPTFALI